VPLFLFSYGARLVPYSTIGVIQFIAPTMQLVCGLVVFGEPFASARATGFVLIWIGLAIYAGNALWRARSANAATA
jgi:chloramphenicol-sensitive protein RarD